MNCGVYQKAALAYAAWKTLLLAHSQIVAAGVRASVCGAIADIERELLSDLELLPPHARDEIGAHSRPQRQRGDDVLMKALSVRQPWVSLILDGIKDVENRRWSTSFRGTFALHSSSARVRADFDEAVLTYRNFADCDNAFAENAVRECSGGFLNAPCGYILGVCDLVDCKRAVVRRGTYRDFAGSTSKIRAGSKIRFPRRVRSVSGMRTSTSTTRWESKGNTTSEGHCNPWKRGKSKTR